MYQGEKSQSIITDRMSNKEDLPSINDYLEDSNLPSYKDFIEENQQLPSVEDYISKSSKEEILVEETVKDIDHVLSETAPEWAELVRLVNDLRKEIPEIPEIKYYDEELSNLSSKLTHIEEYFTQFDQKSNKIDDLDIKNEHLEEKLTEIESKIPEIPTIRYYDHDIEHINDKITQLREDVSSLPEIKHYDSDIASLVEEINKVKSRDIPDFRWISKSFNTIDEDFTRVQGHLDVIKEKISFEVSELNESIQVKDFEQNINVKNLKDNISEKIDQTNTQLTETKDKIYSELSESSLKIWEYHREFKDDDRKLKKAILSEQNKLKQKLEKDITSVNEQSTKTDETLLKFFNELKEEVNSLPEIKYYDNEISSITKDIDSLKVTVSELRGIASLIKKDQKQLQENYLLNEPPSVKQKAGRQTDSLTPLDQNFATLDDLSNHYRLFINRITTQLSTIGGGGETRLQYLDDIAGITTNINAYDGMVLQIDLSQTGEDKHKKFKFAPSGGGAGAGGTWAVGSAGIHTTKNVGIGATARTDFTLHVGGDGQFTGNLSVGGTITYDDVKHVDSVGLSTFRSGIEVNTGTATTALLVRGDARITGILTIGTASITIDGDNETITTGIVTITNSQVNIGSNVVINSGATGINSAPNVFYVAKDGNDTNNGTSIDNAKLTIASAVGVAQSGSVIKVLSGNYVESNPITVPAFVSVVGDDLRSVKVLPNNTTSDLFHVNKGCKLANMTFSGHLAPAAAVAFPTAGATNVGGGKWKGPYIQNCTSDTTTGTGIRVDGDKAVKTKSMNVDAFTQYNQGGVGVAVTNEGYAQLVSVFTICCDKAITCHTGGQVDIANSNCSFGTFGLVADGKSDEQFTGIVTSSAVATQDNVIINVGTGQTRPYDGQVVYFDQLYKAVNSITVANGGSNYTSTPTVTIASPTGPSGETATAVATLEGGSVVSLTIISSGNQYESTPSVTISGGGGSGASVTANMTDIYYTINSSTPITSGITTLTLAENLINTVGVGSTVFFFQQSKIIASSHTFEYIGSGNDITTATPKRGGVTIQANEVVSQNGGKVIYTSTDQAGNFRIGDDLQINQNTGTISGRAFSKSLFSEVTPFILALS